MIDGSISFDGVYAPDSGTGELSVDRQNSNSPSEPLIDAISFITKCCSLILDA